MVQKANYQFYLNGLFVVLALVMLVDFAIPGKAYSREIKEVTRERQNYYNAGGNYHYSYKVITNDRRILVSEDFAQTIGEDDRIEYTVSTVFKEVNWHRLNASGKKSYYSLRLASGLVLPVLLIIAIVLYYRYNKGRASIVFILQVLLIGDLIVCRI